MTKEDSKIVTRTDNSMKKKLKEESAAFFSAEFQTIKKYVQQFIVAGILRYETANRAGKGKKLRKKLKQKFYTDLT